MFNSLGQDVFFAKEDNDCCTRMCCGPGRPFEMNIVDNLGREIIHLGRNRDMWALGTLGQIIDKRTKATMDSATASVSANYGLSPFKYYRGLDNNNADEVVDDEDSH